jgi:polynucleotide 5'-hydroxyl-kinase GRC3/NOL9
MTAGNDRSATIYRRSGVTPVRAQVRGDRCSRGRRPYPLLRRGKEAGLTSQDKGSGGEARRSPTSHVPTHPMLSAFQARKVRLAAIPGVQEPIAPSLAAASPDPQSPAPGPTLRRSSRKRKPESVAGNEADQPQRRKKRDDRKVEANFRYFDAPADVPEPDLHSLTDEDISLSDQEILSQSHAQPQRVWSPSQPLLDSSDEEIETEAGGIQLTNASIPAPTAPFAVELDVNTFRLTPEECLALITIQEPATAVILPVHSIITLTGVYQLTVLQGGVMLMGVTLTSSDTSHTVFSPRLSPLPCIESLGNIDPAPSLISRVPDRLRPWISPEHAVILIRAHSTGIEGLGRVMRTFESMFQPSQLGSPTVDLGVPGVQVHMVPFCPIFPNSKNLLARKWTQQERNLEEFILPTAWDQEASHLLDGYSRLDGGSATIWRPIVCQITGPKSSGKSTFARMLSNRLATRYDFWNHATGTTAEPHTFSYAQVAIIDCDPGQSEFSPCGMVALTLVSKPLFGMQSALHEFVSN